mgnify:FL=1
MCSPQTFKLCINGDMFMSIKYIYEHPENGFLTKENKRVKGRSYKRPNPKPEVNKPCPCGSGIKYKRCCR